MIHLITYELSFPLYSLHPRNLVLYPQHWSYVEGVYYVSWRYCCFCFMYENNLLGQFNKEASPICSRDGGSI